MRVTGTLCGVTISLAWVMMPACFAQPMAGATPSMAAVAPGYRPMTPPPFPGWPAGNATAAAPAARSNQTEDLPAPKKDGNKAATAAKQPVASGLPGHYPMPPMLPRPVPDPVFACDTTPPPAGVAPGMIGPNVFYYSTRVITVRDLSNGQERQLTVSGIPVGARTMFHIAVNESPVPQDRFFLRYNLLKNVNKRAFRFDPVSAGLDPQSLLSFNLDRLASLPGNLAISSHGFVSNLDINQEMFGFEKTFLGGWGSVGVRIPFYQFTQNEDPAVGYAVSRSLDESELGDISVILKGILVSDSTNTAMLTGGVVATLPTGPRVLAYQSGVPFELQNPQNISSTLIQPWLGFYLDFGFAYVQGFSAVVLPIEEGDQPKLLLNSISVGYALFSWLIPTMEFHYIRPTEDSFSQFTEPVGAAEYAILTGGFHIPVGDSIRLTAGASTPVSGPSVYDIEAIVQLNVVF